MKGLDLLLEVFPRYPDLHLYVCGRYTIEPDFCRCYRKELFNSANVHPMGYVRVNSKKYDELVSQCGFVILPSCSEGQPGSVVQCMYSGLVPVVTRDCGIDVGDFGFLINGDSIESIEQVVLDLSHMMPEHLMEMSRKTRQAAESDFSEEAFMRRWREILTLIGV